ncbi:multifunctional acyl-CoA thioesterase I [Hyphomonas johnsonii MHS-2]|uniref:Multifunctional acyl-CoA thioesterase I n=2 Tax=Hyphomonas johnsonii TaxID=81031 RepID=A0A059FRV7_9PROT|nr:multifunctional acyl-CoA thioesterase I [Hyphomonas johnsonii MHS-2]
MLAGAVLLASCDPGPSPEHASQTVPAPVAEAPTDGPVVVFLGDSLVAGFGLAADEALPEQIAAIFKADGVKAKVVNAGVSGDTTANGLARFDWSVANADADVVVVALGANDYLMGIDPEITRRNLTAIVQKAVDDGIACVLVGLQPRSAVEDGSRDAAFAAIYPDIATAFGMQLYPSLMSDVENQPELLQADGLHPTEQGVKIMATRLAAFLDPIVRAYD